MFTAGNCDHRDMAEPTRPAGGFGEPPRPSFSINVVYTGPLHELLAVYERARESGKLTATFEAHSGDRGTARLTVEAIDHYAPVFQTALDELSALHQFAVESDVAS